MGSNNSAKLDDPVATARGSDTDSSRLGCRSGVNSSAPFMGLSLAASGKSMAKAVMPKPPEGGL